MLAKTKCWPKPNEPSLNADPSHTNDQLAKTKCWPKPNEPSLSIHVPNKGSLASRSSAGGR